MSYPVFQCERGPKLAGLLAAAHPQPAQRHLAKLKRKQGGGARGTNVAANHIFIGNSISPTYGADLYPDVGLLSRLVNCVSKLEKQAEDVFNNGGRVVKNIGAGYGGGER